MPDYSVRLTETQVATIEYEILNRDNEDSVAEIIQSVVNHWVEGQRNGIISQLDSADADALVVTKLAAKKVEIAAAATKAAAAEVKVAE
jgi:hypothetical protein